MPAVRREIGNGESHSPYGAIVGFVIRAVYWWTPMSPSSDFVRRAIVTCPTSVDPNSESGIGLVGGTEAVSGDVRKRSIDAPYVPCFQDETYSSCSGVIGSSVIPSAASFSRATSASIASGTT